jgi:hypothetical protein
MAVEQPWVILRSRICGLNPMIESLEVNGTTQADGNVKADRDVKAGEEIERGPETIKAESSYQAQVREGQNGHVDSNGHGAARVVSNGPTANGKGKLRARICEEVIVELGWAILNEA